MVAMVGARVMQVSGHQIVDMVGMWHRIVTAIGSMLVSCIVTAAGVLRCA
jgi:hypothetical protein